MSKHSSYHKLYCISPKGKEFISNIEIINSGSHDDNIAPINQIISQNEMVIKDYSKDNSLWKNNTLDNNVRFDISCANGDDSKALINFGNYLFQRQKTGIVDIESTSLNPSTTTFYVLPPFTQNQVILHGTYILKQTTSSNTNLSNSNDSSNKLDLLTGKVGFD